VDYDCLAFFVTYFQVGYEETRQEGVKLYTALTKLKFVPGHFMDFKHFPAIFCGFFIMAHLAAAATFGGSSFSLGCLVFE